LDAVGERCIWLREQVRGRAALSLIFRGYAMITKVESLSKYLVRTGAVLVVAMGASACSTVPDWVDPTTWIGGDSDTADQTAPPDQTADNSQAANAQTPDLSTIPDKPQAPSTSDEQKKVADSLAADRSRTEYSGDALRGGTEPAAAPPPAEAGPTTEELAANDNNAAAPAPPPPQPVGPPAAGPGTLPADNGPPPAAAAQTPPPSPAAAPTTQVASIPTPPPSAVPAVPAASMTASMVTPSMNPTDAQLGFRPSGAPPLDATVAQFVAPSILARYQQTAAIGPQPAVPSTMPAATDSTAYAMNAPGEKHLRRHKAAMGVGGPEAMTGAVVANFDALQAGNAASQAAYAGAGGAPAAVVFFPHDTTVLSGEARSQVRDAAKAFMARGGEGYVKVIGHSSSRTGSMSMARHLVWNFERSEARANAVARALIREGVPADKVLVQAVGDDQPVYTESMPQGEDGNRRAEIFFQS
jgi:flagellar motor protein MotB